MLNVEYRKSKIMKYTICIVICCLVSMSLYSQNLILNSSFEQNLKPYCEGWYSGCGKELCVDSLGGCSTQIYEDSPGDSLVDQWCLLIYGNTWPFENYTDYYVTGRTGTFIYQMKLWMNTMHNFGYGRLGVLDHGVFIQKDSVEDILQPWTEYIIEDTLTTSSTDTIVVRLAAGIGDFCFCDVYFDLVELTVLDSLSTKVETISNQDEISIFPNPVQDKLQIMTNSFSRYRITILNSYGQSIMENEFNGIESVFDLTDQSSGVYYYSISESKNSRILKSGKFVKL